MMKVANSQYLYMKLFVSDDESESDPELREPQVKRRRLLNSSDKKSQGYETSDELEQGSNEDIIPFAEEEYESIDYKTMPQTEEEHSWKKDDETKLNESTSSSTTTITNNCTKIHHHSDIENSWNDNTNFQEVNSHLTWLFPTDVDEQRRQRIQYSPVKSFYKTVPLDETGATDTEVPRISMSDWPAESLGCPTDMHVLTDSLIVNAEEEPEMDSSDDIKEILSMLNDDENGNPKWGRIEQQGTQWREFKYGKTCYPLSFKRNWLLGYIDNNDKDMENSICSQTWSEIPHLNGAIASLGSIRLPSHYLRTTFRSASMSHWSASNYRDSDTTGPDQSDAPPYEWDDYRANLPEEFLFFLFHPHILKRDPFPCLHILMKLKLLRNLRIHIIFPPAKVEDGWDDKDDNRDISVLTIEDDFHMQLGSSHSSFPTHLLHSSNRSSYITDEKKTLTREKAPRPVAAVTGKCIRKHSDTGLNDKLELVKSRTIPLISKLLNSSKSRHFSESDLDNVLTVNSDTTNNSTECIPSFPLASLPQQSLLPIILSKIEKFASSLKLIHHDDSGLDSSFSTLSSIRSLGDVDSTLKIFNDIHERLLEEQEELQSLLSSDSFSGDLSSLLGEFEPLCRGYEEAVERVEQLMTQIEAIRDKWNDWAETQRIIQMMMRTIESDLSDLRKGTDNSEQICSELELCQERMNRLETACNYLSCNLASLHHRSSTQQPPPIDFTSELALYSNALIQLKTRFEKEIGHAKSVDKATFVRSRKRVHLNDDEKTTSSLRHDSSVNIPHISWSIKMLFIVAVIAAFTAWFATSSLVPWRTTLGPHLDYVDGPPPL
ncbi:hypothetical protein X798_07846 [Onchocerca flexuosa]|uniref:KASH domain-containing protein n=2 Tax=Onchocerca flexuosa TaxID=387005 RepID=A0A238BIH7_9BILA|nr:hypothetical protein X798_07846 [Onchocerca flexuosa]